MTGRPDSWRTGLLGALLALVGCAGDDPKGRRDAEQSPQPAAATVSEIATATATATDSASLAAAPAEESTVFDVAEREQAQRLAQAQAYLDRARDDAQARHRLALAHCRNTVTVDFDACEATADESLDAKLRAARVEFDAQMMQSQ